MARTTRKSINGQNGADRPFHRHFLGAARGMIGEIFVGDSGSLFAEKKRRPATRYAVGCRRRWGRPSMIGVRAPRSGRGSVRLTPPRCSKRGARTRGPVSERAGDHQRLHLRLATVSWAARNRRPPVRVLWTDLRKSWRAASSQGSAAA